jgi:putative tryptophan/tyrosine transport system substrate-binding protein
MRRRDFIKTLVGAASLGPSFAAPAQTAERARLIGLLNILGSDDPEALVRLTIFQQALQQLGWEVGRDLKIENRQVGGDRDRLHRYATELGALAPDVIVSIGSVSVGAVQQATRTIPIVFVNVPDPVGAGFVQNMALSLS